MGWADLIFNLVLCLGDLLSFVVVSHDLSKRARLAGPGPHPNVEPDAWRCPNASEIARVIGVTPASRSEGRLVSLPVGPDPLWDRERDG
jgi:hypothetical protein